MRNETRPKRIYTQPSETWSWSILHADPINYIYVRLAFSQHSHFIAGKCCLTTTPLPLPHCVLVCSLQLYDVSLVRRDIHLLQYNAKRIPYHTYYTTQTGAHGEIREFAPQNIVTKCPNAIFIKSFPYLLRLSPLRFRSLFPVYAHNLRRKCIRRRIYWRYAI